MLRVAVVEDDPFYVEKLKKDLLRYEEEKSIPLEISFFSDGEDIIENYKAEYQIVLMDIQMRFLDGLTTARYMREKDENFILIFITSMSGLAIKGYDVDASDFLVKPVDYAVLAQKLDRARRRLGEDREHYLLLPVDNGVRKISASEICYIESDHHRMVFHTCTGIIDSRGRLEDLERELGPYGFFRSSKWYLVNLRAVDGVEEGECLIAGDRLLISRRKKAAFMEQLAKIL